MTNKQETLERYIIFTVVIGAGLLLEYINNNLGVLTMLSWIITERATRNSL